MGDLRHGRARGLTFDGNATANRMASVSLNGVQQANYEYNFLGQQVIRRLASGDTIHSVNDICGNWIAEYSYHEVAGTSSLIREYIWAGDRLVGVWENGSYYAVRTDHIGRPIFATNVTGTVVWDATYLPFGGVDTSSGPNADLRFPGQWFQAEAGLHQNWMQDYDPTLGQYLQADPLGLVDGPSIYGYALQNPGRYVDPRGEQSFAENFGNGFGSYFDGLFGCVTGGCIDPRVPIAMYHFSNMLAENPELRDCIVLLLKQLEAEHAGYLLGRATGAGTTTTFTLLALRGRTDRGANRQRKGFAAANLLGPTIGGISNFIGRHGDPTPTQFAQLWVFGRVLADEVSCMEGCLGD